MRPGTSTLNPYAASYVPISKRETVEHTHAPGLVLKASQSNYNVSHGPEHATESREHENSSLFTTVSARHFGEGFYGSSSHTTDGKIYKQLMDEEYDIDLEYLRMLFPGVSSESLLDVYAANNGDLDNTVDMLNQLEVAIPENLPDTLDIGDVPESVTARKQKYVVGEGSSSSSGSSA